MATYKTVIGRSIIALYQRRVQRVRVADGRARLGERGA